MCKCVWHIQEEPTGLAGEGERVMLAAVDVLLVYFTSCSVAHGTVAGVEADEEAVVDRVQVRRAQNTSVPVLKPHGIKWWPISICSQKNARVQ